MCGKMHNGIHTFHNLGQGGAVRDVGYDQLETVRQEGVPARQVVVDDGFISMAAQSPRRVASDVSRSTHYQNRQVISSLLQAFPLPPFVARPAMPVATSLLSRWPGNPHTTRIARHFGE